MAYNPANPNGNTTAANSAPVTLASDNNGPVKIFDGTNTANVVPGDSGFNGLATVAGTKTYTFTTSASGAQTILANTSCEGFSSIEVVYTSVGSGLTLTGQFSTASGGSYVNQSTFTTNNAAPTGGLGVANNTIYRSAIMGNYFQIAVSALTSGTFTGTVTLRNTPMFAGSFAATTNYNSQLTTGTITTSSTSITSSSLSGYGGFLEVSIHGTYAGITFGITESDDGGTTFYNVPIYDGLAQKWLAPGTAITPATNANGIWWIPVFPNTNQLKVLSSAFTSGTGNIRIQTSPGAMPGNTMATIWDAGGNSRGANVDANNNLQVSQATAANLNATVMPGNATAASAPAVAMESGAVAETALPTAVTGGQLVGVMSDKFGRQVVLPGTVRDLVGTQTTTISASTSETTIVTQAASVFNDLYLLVISNTSSATTTRIDFRDTTGGSVLFSVFSPAGDTRGFSMGGVAIPQTTVNTNWTATCGTSTTDIRIYAVFAKNK